MATLTVAATYCKGCGLCVHFCPRQVLALGDKFNAAGYRVVGIIAPENCNGCTFCAIMCPDLAIKVYR